MNSIPNNRSVIGNAFQGAFKGAVYGTVSGTVFVCTTIGVTLFQGLLETANRAFGNEPNWPTFRGDCQLPQFQQTVGCEEPLFESFASFAYYGVVGASLTGMVVGAIHEVAQKRFIR